MDLLLTPTRAREMAEVSSVVDVLEEAGKDVVLDVLDMCAEDRKAGARTRKPECSRACVSAGVNWERERVGDDGFWRRRVRNLSMCANGC